MKNLVSKYNNGLEFYLQSDNEIRKIGFKDYRFDDPWFGAKNRTLTDYKCWKRYRKTQYKIK